MRKHYEPRYSKQSSIVTLSNFIAVIVIQNINVLLLPEVYDFGYMYVLTYLTLYPNTVTIRHLFGAKPLPKSGLTYW